VRDRRAQGAEHARDALHRVAALRILVELRVARGRLRRVRFRLRFAAGEEFLEIGAALLRQRVECRGELRLVEPVDLAPCLVRAHREAGLCAGDGCRRIPIMRERHTWKAMPVLRVVVTLPSLQEAWLHRLHCIAA
jgi:hypothetical protein